MVCRAVLRFGEFSQHGLVAVVVGGGGGTV